MTSFSSQEKNKIKNILLWMTTLGQASLAIYLPAFPVIANELAMTPTMVAQTITFFMIGFGASPFFYGPLSDRYGRKPILLISLSIACVGYLINIFANDGFLFLSARLIEGVGCGGLLIGGRSIMRDVFSGRELASAASYLSMAFAIGFGLTPVIGGYLSTHLNWRFSFGVLLMMTFLIMLMLFLYLPETNFEKENRTPLKHFLAQTFSAYRQIFIHFSFLKFLLGGVFAYGVVVAYNVMTPFLLQGPFGLSALQYGYLAPLMGIPYFLGAFYNKNLVLKLGVKPIFCVGFTLISVAGISILVLNELGVLSVFSIIGPMMIAIFGQSLIFSNTIAVSLQLFPAKLGGKVAAMFSGLQILMASGLSAVIALLSHQSAIPIACVIIFLGLGCAVVLFNVKNE